MNVLWKFTTGQTHYSHYILSWQFDPEPTSALPGEKPCKHRDFRDHLRVSVSAGLGWDPRAGIYDKKCIPGVADAAGPRPTRCKPLLYNHPHCTIPISHGVASCDIQTEGRREAGCFAVHTKNIIVIEFLKVDLTDMGPGHALF